MAGAQPSLTAITDDASRGGLFVQSNVANPVSGSDIRGEVVNDTTITLSITINGDTQTQSFTTNQAAISTEAFDFTVAGGTGGTADGVVTGGSFSGNTLTLTRSGNESDSVRTDTDQTHPTAHQTHPTCLLYTSPSPRD